MKRDGTHYNTNRSRDFKTNYYVDGNTVRRLEGEPEERRRKQLEEEQEQKRRRNRRVAKRNQERALRVNFGYVFFCAAAVLLFCVVCVAYIRLQSDIVGRTKRISGLESQIVDLRAENDAAVKRIDLSTDLAAVKEKAFALGMKYATAEQIIYYTIEDNDFMEQYFEIPEK